MTDTKLITLEDVARALDYIAADDRDIWVKMAMAIKSEFGEGGYSTWDAWSQGSDLYKTSDAKAVWKSVKASGRTGIGSLIKTAGDGGFKFSVKGISKEERARRTADAESRRIENKKRREADALAHKQKNETAAARAEKMWPGLAIEGKSDYLARKKIHHCGARFSRGSVVVPVTKNGKLTGLQFIAADGSKKFITGTEKQGAYFHIAGFNGRAVVCEGFATGCSIWMATRYDVFVAFDAGNLGSVVEWVLNQDLPDLHNRPIFLAADNDHTKPINKGLQVAEQICARHAHIKPVWPEFGPDDLKCSDFNDLHVLKGLNAVADYFQQAHAPQAFRENFSPEENNPDDFMPPDDVDSDPYDQEHWYYRFVTSKSGAVMPSAANVLLALENDPHWKGKLAYCDFSYRLIKREAPLPDMQPGEWEDADTARLRIWLSNTWSFEPARQNIADALIAVAQRNRFHPVRDYLAGLVWDGTPRLDHWLSDVYQSTTDAEYLKMVGRFFMIGAVARVMRPGCKMDNVMILEGRQGLRKSTSVATLFGEWFSDAQIPIGEKDAYQNIQGIWCSELAELDSFNKAESNSAKMFFSQRRDRYRPSYGHNAQDFKRQCIFVGTTNQSEYLKDYSGNRRYWPVRCTFADIAQIRDNRDQYWGEALHRFNAGEPWWPGEESAALFDEIQENRMQVDPWQYDIEDYLLTTIKDYYTSAEILFSGIGKDMNTVTRADQNRISPIMKALGWKNVRKRILVKGQSLPRHVYVKTELTDDL